MIKLSPAKSLADRKWMMGSDLLIFVWFDVVCCYLLFSTYWLEDEEMVGCYSKWAHNHRLDLVGSYQEIRANVRQTLLDFHVRVFLEMAQLKMEQIAYCLRNKFPVFEAGSLLQDVCYWGWESLGIQIMLDAEQTVTAIIKWTIQQLREGGEGNAMERKLPALDILCMDSHRNMTLNNYKSLKSVPPPHFHTFPLVFLNQKAQRHSFFNSLHFIYLFSNMHNTEKVIY